MSKQKTIKTLEELAKAEYTTATALDAALADAGDGERRKNYRKWRDFHIKQAEALNSRIKDLGGPAKHEEFTVGRGRRRLLGGMRRDHNGKSLAAVRLAAERGVKHYIEHLDSVDDPRTLKLIRKNLEAKQSEMQWYDDQAFMEHNVELEAKLEKTRAIVKSLEKEVKEEKRENRRRSPLAALAVAGAIGAAAYLIAQRNEAPDDEDEIGEKYNYEDGGGAAHIENGAENGAEA